MANFKTHIGWGVVIGVGAVIFGLIYSMLSAGTMVGWVFLAVIIGSLLPDLDMDEGLPFQILFGLMGVGAAGLFFYVAYQGGERDWKYLAIISALAFAIMRFVIGYIFKKFTDHRGMFHSIPAVVLSGLTAIWLMHWLSVQENQELLIGLAVALGYLGHLVLDEIYASVNLSGYSLLPKKSLGSALKLYSSSKITTLIFYILILILALTLPETKSLM
jgi:hypothetical protein